MRYTVIGLGQFGQELCTELSARNIEVVAVASTDEELEQIKDLVTYAVVTDYTNPGRPAGTGAGRPVRRDRRHRGQL